MFFQRNIAHLRGGYGNKYYSPFWIQVISHMAAKKRDTGDEGAEIYTEERNNPIYQHEKPIEVFARIRGEKLIGELKGQGVISTNEKGYKVLQAEMSNISLKEHKPELVLLYDRDATGRFSTRIYPDKVGSHEIWIKTKYSDTRHTFKIIPPIAELQEKPIDVATLATISHPKPEKKDDDNQPHCFYPPYAFQLVIKPLILKDKTSRVEEELSDAPILFIFIIILLAIEWIIRKRAKLL